MKRVWLIGLIAAAGLLAQDQDSIHHSFAGAKSIEVDTVFGSIHVVAYDGTSIEMDAKRTITADDSERDAAARREVKLDITETGGDARVYVDGPFRCNCGERRSFRSHSDVHERGRRGYKVAYDFEVKVPRTAAIYLSTVNEGHIRVERTGGDFDIENINGGIDMVDVAGSGRVYALNKSVHVTFTKNPEKNSYFGSLNGDVEVWFQPGLSADARVKTFNGGIFTDFQTSALPVVASSPERKNGKFVYRSNDFQGIRIGSGGPEYKFENFNGEIRIRNRGK